MSPKYIALLCAGVVLTLLLVALKLYGSAQYDKGYQAAQIEYKDDKLDQLAKASEEIAGFYNGMQDIADQITVQSGKDNIPPLVRSTIADKLSEPKPASK